MSSSWQTVIQCSSSGLNKVPDPHQHPNLAQEPFGRLPGGPSQKHPRDHITKGPGQTAEVQHLRTLPVVAQLTSSDTVKQYCCLSFSFTWIQQLLVNTAVWRPLLQHSSSDDCTCDVSRTRFYNYLLNHSQCQKVTLQTNQMYSPIICVTFSPDAKPRMKSDKLILTSIVLYQ